MSCCILQIDQNLLKIKNSMIFSKWYICCFILQIDRTLLGSYVSGRSAPQVAIVLGHADALARDLPIYGHALRKAGFTFNIPPKYSSNEDSKGHAGIERLNVLLLLVSN